MELPRGFHKLEQKNIPAIEHMLLQLSTRFGEEREFDGKTFFLFPSARQLALASESGLRECSLGFRAKYVKATAQKIVDEDINLEDLRKLPYIEARSKLLEFMGVASKWRIVCYCFRWIKLERPR
jgi:N-glycosylase/DNA lyase